MTKNKATSILDILNSMTGAEKIKALSSMSPEQLAALGGGGSVPAPVDLVPVVKYEVPGEDALTFGLSQNNHFSVSCKGFKGGRTFNAMQAVVMSLHGKRQQRWLLANIEALNLEDAQRDAAAVALGEALGLPVSAVEKFREEQRALLKKG